MSKRVFLQELYVPDKTHGAPDLDLVLVHGIDGDPVNTWKDTNSGNVWPIDLLPQCQPRTRVLSLGYNGDMYRNNCIASVRDNARSLLNFLKIKRQRVGPERPIVFVAHCLGGLIVKQALYVAEFEKAFSTIKAATVGVLFFGTPHKGTTKDDWDRLAKSFSPLDKATRGSRSPLVDAMLRNSHALADINAKFRQLAENFTITSFYETGVLPGTSTVIVDKTAGSMMTADEERIQVDTDHVAMCAFDRVDDPTFEAMCYHILRSTEVEEESEVEDDTPTTMQLAASQTTAITPSTSNTTTVTIAAIKKTTTTRDLAGATQITEHTEMWYQDGSDVDSKIIASTPRMMLPAPAQLPARQALGFLDLSSKKSIPEKETVKVSGLRRDYRVDL